MATSKLKILQTNLQHSRMATEATVRKLNNHTTNVVLAQEPWINGNRVVGFGSKFSLFTASSPNRPRTCVTTKKEISAWLLPQVSDANCTSVLLRVSGGKTIIIASVYMPFEARPEDTPSNMVQNLVDYAVLNHYH